MLYGPNTFNLSLCFMKVSFEGRVIWYTKLTLFMSVLHPQVVWEGAKYIVHGFLVTSECLLSRKVWWSVPIGSFLPKLGYFTNQNELKGVSPEYEFWLFSNTKMNARDS